MRGGVEGHEFLGHFSVVFQEAVRSFIALDFFTPFHFLADHLALGQIENGIAVG